MLSWKYFFQKLFNGFINSLLDLFAEVINTRFNGSTNTFFTTEFSSIRSIDVIGKFFRVEFNAELECHTCYWTLIIFHVFSH